MRRLALLCTLGLFVGTASALAQDSDLMPVAPVEVLGPPRPALPPAGSAEPDAPGAAVAPPVPGGPAAPSPSPAPEPTATPRPKLPDGLTVRSALRRGWLAARLDRAAYERGLAAEERVRRLLRRVQGRRRAELLGAYSLVAGLAAQERLHSSRLPLAVATLRANAHAASRLPLPAPRARMTFDGLVFQHVAGRGWQHHPLGSFGRANALAKPCVVAERRRSAVRVPRALAQAAVRRVGESFRPRVRPVRAPRCHAAALRQTMDALAGAAVDRGGFLAWEYLYPYGPGPSPWISAMTQGTAVQALARGAAALAEDRYAVVAERALRAFEVPPPRGVRVGDRFAMYSQVPSLDVLNGYLQSLIGLHDHARLTGSRRSARLFDLGERSAPAAVRAADTGAWSLYSRGGAESTLHYHRLVGDFLGGLCRRTARKVYCAAQKRFARYEREAPRLSVALPARLRAESPSRIVLSLSKGSTVRVRARGFSRRLSLGRGRHVIGWTPARRGATRVRVSATGPEGRTAAVVRGATVLMSLREIAARRRARQRAQARERALIERARRLGERARREAARAHGQALRRAQGR